MTSIRIASAGEPVHVESRWRFDGPGSIVALVLPSTGVTLTPREACCVAAELEKAAARIEEGT